MIYFKLLQVKLHEDIYAQAGQLIMHDKHFTGVTSNESLSPASSWTPCKNGNGNSFRHKSVFTSIGLYGQGR